jgi:hypothetical protein
MSIFSIGIHPALRLSLRHQTRGQLRRLGQSFATPRRIALSTTALLLAVVWLGNMAVSLLFREPYSEGAVAQWTRLGLTIYALWHWIRTAWERPEQSLEWSTAEEQFLVNGPFTRRQLVRYRLLIVARATVLKATIATILILPDVSRPAVTLIALCLGLFTIELIRIALDTWTANMNSSEFSLYRSTVLGLAGGAAIWMFEYALVQWRSVSHASVPPIVTLMAITLESLRVFTQSEYFQFISWPFRQVADLMVAPTASWGVLLQLAAIAGAELLAVEGVLRLDSAGQRRLRDLEAANLRTASREQTDGRDAADLRLPTVYLGAVAWRQFCGMRLHLVGVLLALVAPAMLTFIPFVMLKHEPDVAFTNFVASLAFYTLLLLPPALKFDFRRDYDRLLALKMLPASPMRVTLGQIAVPVLVATLFQWTMVLSAFLVRPVSPGFALAAICLFLPANLAIFGVDNLLFLMFPHRLKQEGLDVFLRTTLVFTAKGLIFGLVLVGIVVWSVAARSISESLLTMGLSLGGPLVIFGVGLWAIIALTAGGAISLTASAFRHFDPSRGMVA